MSNAIKLIKKYENIMIKTSSSQYLKKFIITINNLNIELILQNFVILIEKRFITKISRVLFRRSP